MFGSQGSELRVASPLSGTGESAIVDTTSRPHDAILNNKPALGHCGLRLGAERGGKQVAGGD